MQTTPLVLLKQPPPKVYELGPNDVLGVYIEGVLPATAPDTPPTNPPVYFPSQYDPLSSGLQPSLGFPIPIQDDGTVALPLVDPVRIAGMSIPQATDAVRRAYIDRQILQPGRERIIITLMQPRRTRVAVIRQEVGGLAINARGFITTSSTKRGVGAVVDLRAYENDVLTALTETGGLPGLDTYSDIFVFKRAQNDGALIKTLENLRPGEHPSSAASLCPRVIQIPTRIPCGQQVPFRPEDVILDTGDVLFLEARAGELFYTGGLLPSAEFVLPRDYDLDVVEAVAFAKGSLINGAFAGSNLAGLIVQPGIGNPSPTLLTVLRRTPNGGHVPIRVDLNHALRDARERISVHPGDVLILQETPEQAMARYFTQVFNFNITSRWIQTSRTTGTAVLDVP